MQHRTIAIVAGGYSSEYEVSLRSAEGIHSFMPEHYHCYTALITPEGWIALYDGQSYSIDRNDFGFVTHDGTRIVPDFAYITIHGTPGEDGTLQGYFDLIGLPYNTGGVLVEALTFNKFVLNNFLRSFGYTISDSIRVVQGQPRPTDHDIVRRLGLPCFVKPNAGGSSFGVTKVKHKSELATAINTALKESSEVMIEALMTGTEITCGCYHSATQGMVVFPITEVVTTQEFFDYDAKYNGKVEEITPARIATTTTERVQALTAEIYRLIGARGIIRIDYMLSGPSGEEHIYLIEVNTTPGMTKTSFIPQQVRAAGIDIREVMADIIESALAI
ncbi:MAG: D-alanine--D-alanine ligase [Bacteroidales bacterium]|nr:D-alanine--D-alanine ligase [Bacteroidales bacterium]